MKLTPLRWNPVRGIQDIFSVWQDTRLIVLAAQVAAIYAAILIPFKVGIPIIPGFVELRPANAIPIVTSLLFGPVAAWGAGIGNVIGDCFGTLGPASVFGFLGNFFLAYIPYMLWGSLGPLSSGQPPYLKTWRQGLEFGIVCVVASGACAIIIAWGVELLGLLPFMILAPAIFVNNVVMGMLLGPPLLLFLYPRVKQWGLYYPCLYTERQEHKNEKTKSVFSNESNLPLQMSSQVDSMIEIDDVTFRYPSSDNPALRNLSLKVPRGECIVVMGARGSGKSSLCYVLNGLIPHFLTGTFEGTVKINGLVTVERPVWEQAKNVGMVFQDFDTQLLSTNVEREIAFPLEHVDPPLRFEEMTERIQWSLHEVGLKGLHLRDPLSLSGGQRQRLVVGSTLVRSPIVLVLDQPTTDLDPEARTHLKKLLLKLCSQGTTVLLTEQEPEEILQADRLCILDQGKIGWDGNPHDFLRRPEFSAQFGIRPLPLAECFVDLGIPVLPVTVEEAWDMMDKYGLTLDAFHITADKADELLDQSPKESGVVVDINNITFGYTPETTVLNDVSLSICSGEFVAVLGRNGSGKTTFGKLLNGLLIPSEGRVDVCGYDTRQTVISDLARVVGYVFQNPDHQIFAETVWEEVAFSVKNLGVLGEEGNQQIRNALTAVGFDVRASQSQDPFSLPKGQRQQVAVASVLAAKPQVLIFDEPTTGLDAGETDRMMEMIRMLNTQGHTIVMITHSMRLVAEYASRCILMHGGKIMADDSTRRVFSDSSLLEAASLEVPAITKFSQRWGYTLLRVDEVKASLKN